MMCRECKQYGAAGRLHVHVHVHVVKEIVYACRPSGKGRVGQRRFADVFGRGISAARCGSNRHTRCQEHTPAGPGPACLMDPYDSFAPSGPESLLEGQPTATGLRRGPHARAGLQLDRPDDRLCAGRAHLSLFTARARARLRPGCRPPLQCRGALPAGRAAPRRAHHRAPRAAAPVPTEAARAR